MKKLTVLLMFIALSGCATFKGVDLVENETTHISAENSQKVNVKTIRVTQHNDTVYVKGRVARDKDIRIHKGFVTVDLYNERGVRIDSIDANIRFKRRGSRFLRSGTYSAQLEEIPQKNSKVVVRARDYKKESDKGSGTLKLM